MSGETFNSVAFRCISNPHPRLDSSLRWNDGAQGAGMRGSRLRGNDVCEQCSNHGGYGVRGSCRWFGVAVEGREGGSRTAPTPRQGSHPAFLQRVLVFGHFGRYPTSGAHGFSGVIRSEDPPYPGPIWPDLLLTTRSTLDSSLRWNDGDRGGRDGETFNSVAFGRISLHFQPSPSPGFQPSLE